MGWELSSEGRIEGCITISGKKGAFGLICEKDPSSDGATGG